MIARLKLRIYIWLLDHNILTCAPWDDPRKPVEDRIMWLKAQPKSLRKAG